MRALLVAAALAASAAAAENPLAGLFGPENLKQAEIAGATVRPGRRPDTVVLRFPATETPAGITVPVPPAGRDWSRAGALTFEFVSDSTIRWDLEIRNRQGGRTVFRVQPWLNVPVKAAIANSFLTREYMNNRQFKGYWLSNWANHIDLSDVASISIRMNPDRAVTLTLGPVALEAGEVSDEVYAKSPVVDRFGQWIGLDWPGKVRSDKDLLAAWKAEDAALAKPAGFEYSRWGGWRAHRLKPSGFFRAEAIDGKWWLVDPDGYLFFSAGPDCVRHADPTRVAGRGQLFAQLPPGSGETADFYRANAEMRYGQAEFAANWKRKAWQRLRAWGFNTVANWSDPALFEKPEAPFVTNVSVGRIDRAWQGFPDVYSPAFRDAAREQARRQCGRFREEPFLIGYFIGNEPRWPHRNLIDLILRDPQPSETQAFVRRFLSSKGDTPSSRDELMETISRHYFKQVCDAIREADPNHLVLGIRWAGSAPDPVLKANDVFDVFSINIYRFEPDAKQIERLHALTGRPVMIGEFHFGAAERGYAPSLVMVRDQTERGVAYQYYLERAAALAPVVGAHWFQMVDQPVTGRYDGENYNIGFVNAQDVPYSEMVSYAKAAHRRMYGVHAGGVAPVERRAIR